LPQFRKPGVRRIALTKSYRSVRGIQRFVNAAFEQEMSGDEKRRASAYHPSMRTALTIQINPQ